MKKSRRPSFIRPALTASICTLMLMTGCGSKGKKPLTASSAENAHSTSSSEKQLDAVLTARVQAISRKNNILTLKFPDNKVGKIKCGPGVSNLGEVGVGDTITARFRDHVEVYVATPGGKPAWPEVQEIKKSPKGIRPGTAIIRPYEFAGTVDSVDPASRKVVLRGHDGKYLRVFGNPEVARFNEIRPGDSLVARFTEITDMKIAPSEIASTARRPARR